jgi:hypothetical protein
MSHQDAYVKEDRLNADCLNEAFLWLFKGIDWSAISNSRPLEFDSSWFAHSDIYSMIRHGLRGEKGVR